jgi:hypothetical protein
MRTRSAIRGPRVVIIAATLNSPSTTSTNRDLVVEIAITACLWNEALVFR